ELRSPGIFVTRPARSSIGVANSDLPQRPVVAFKLLLRTSRELHSIPALYGQNMNSPGSDDPG
ncbi:MAG: hypothetical protein JXR56_00875, partial [Candidatus Cloacimonetes bacterium]|nr:hypothetical protein [Candidatus Cloacimonadota bacterium]